MAGLSAGCLLSIAAIKLDSSVGAEGSTLLSDGGGATRRLPSAALSARQGGDILTDPGDDLEPLQPVVVLDLRLSGRPDAPAIEGGERLGERLGERAWVRFDAGFAPLALQAAGALQRQVQRRFNAQF